MEHKNLKIFVDASGETFGYELMNDEAEVILSGDSYETVDAVIEELSSWNNALRQIFG